MLNLYFRARFAYKLNTRPRKRLGFKTPYEVYYRKGSPLHFELELKLPDSSQETYAYDASGARTIKTDAGGTTYYFFPGYEESVSGEQTLVRKYYYANGSRIAMRAGTELDALVTDHLGSATVLVGAAGTVDREQGYEPFGESLYATGTFDPVYTFTGKELDDTGAYYFGARYHDPELGRFLTPDPLALELD